MTRESYLPKSSSSHSLTSPQWIQEEEEPPHCRADVEGVEGLLQGAQLGQGGDQLQDIVFKVHLPQVA